MDAPTPPTTLPKDDLPRSRGTAAAFLKARWPWILVWAILGAFTLVPIWAVRFLPLQDLPQHLSIIHALHNYGGPAFGYDRYLELHPTITTYLTYYYGADLLAYLMPVEAANKVFLSVYVLGLPAAVAYAARAFGRPAWVGLFACPLVFNYSFHMGFVSYCLGMALLFAGIGLWESMLVRPTRFRAVAIAFHGPLLFFTHSLTFLIGTAIAFFLAGLHSWRRPKVLLRRLAPAAPGLLVFLAWFLSVFGSEAPADVTARVHGVSAASFFGADYGATESAFTRLGEELTPNFAGSLDEWILAAWLLILLAFLLLRTRPAPDPGDSRGWFLRHRLEILVWALCAVYFAAPMSIQGIWAISPRLPILGALALILLIDFSPTRPRHVIAIAPIVLLGCLNSLLVLDRYREFDREAESAANVLGPLENGRKVFALTYVPSSAVAGKAPYLHFASYYMLEHGGATGCSFFENPSVPVRLRNPADFPCPAGLGEWHPDWFRFDIDGPSYDYFIVRDPSGAHTPELRALAPGIELVSESGPWSVYRNRGREERPGAVRLQFLDRLSRANVALRSADGPVVPCDEPLPHGRRCPIADWARVSAEMPQVERVATPCIWAHPVNGHRLEITFEDVQLAQELSGFVTIADSGIRNPAPGADVDLEVLAGGHPVGRAEAPNIPGLRPFRFDTSRFARAGRLDVTFAISTRSDVGRDFCFDARVVAFER